VIAKTLNLHDKSKIMSLDDVLEIDKVSRASAKEILKNI
jgi:1-deoxy-D-xylulose 5-phosphate reductoisomerase